MDQQVKNVDDRIRASEAQDGSSAAATWLKRHIVFLLTVALPTCIAVIYYGLIASDVYISESRFLVRSPQQHMQSGLFTEFLQGTGISRSEDDTYSVRDFIISRDALKQLNDKLDLRRSYSSKDIDWLGRFPTFGWDTSFESLYRYYGKRVGVDYDPVSSISVLTVEAYTARDAQRINQMLLDMSEQLVNSLNDRSRHDLMHFAEDEVKIASERSRDASLALLDFRSKQSVFEPDKQAAIQLEGVARLQEELVSTEAELAQVTKLSPSNPQIVGLESRVQTLRAAISAEASKVTGGGSSLSVHASSFERLQLESEFAAKQLGSALAALETARSEAARQQLYLERLVQPNLPDKALEPRRARSVFTVFVLSLIVWGVVSLVLASVREHTD